MDLSRGDLPSISLAVIDPAKPFSLEDFKNSDAVAWVFDKGVAVRNANAGKDASVSNGEIRIIDLPTDLNATFTRALVEANAYKLRRSRAPFLRSPQGE